MKSVTLGTRTKKAFVLFALLSVLSSCTTTIESLKQNPNLFGGRNVRINATVKQVIPLPFTDYSIFLLDEDSASLPLISTQSYPKNTTVRAKVRVVAIVDSTDDKKLSQVLENELTQTLQVDSGMAEKISSLIITVWSKIADTISGTFLLIEPVE